MARKISSLYISIRKNRVFIKILNVRNQCPHWSPNIRHTDTIATLHLHNTHWKYTKQQFISKYIVAITTLRCIKYHQTQFFKLISCDWTVPCLLVEPTYKPTTPRKLIFLSNELFVHTSIINTVTCIHVDIIIGESICKTIWGKYFVCFLNVVCICCFLMLIYSL